jgi:hypothetical protein
MLFASIFAVAICSIGANPVFAADCAQVEIATGTCPPPINAGIGGGQVDLSGEGSSGGGTIGPGGVWIPAPCVPEPIILKCLSPLNGKDQANDPVALVTWSDIESFRPTAGIDAMEPAGWSIIGLPTNFYATGSDQIISGDLLGFAASVHFIPVGYRWSYGDGASRASVSGGASWAALGLAEFDETATSHSYSAPGTFAIDLAIDYRAEYQFAGRPWRTLAGTIPVAANRLITTAADADTVLVLRDCAATPKGPGC